MACAAMVIAAGMAWQQSLLGVCVAAALACQTVNFWGNFATGRPFRRSRSITAFLATVIQNGARQKESNVEVQAPSLIRDDPTITDKKAVD